MPPDPKSMRKVLYKHRIPVQMQHADHLLVENDVYRWLWPDDFDTRNDKMSKVLIILLYKRYFSSVALEVSFLTLKTMFHKEKKSSLKVHPGFSQSPDILTVFSCALFTVCNMEIYQNKYSYSYHPNVKIQCIKYQNYVLSFIIDTFATVVCWVTFLLYYLAGPDTMTHFSD